MNAYNSDNSYTTFLKVLNGEIEGSEIKEKWLEQARKIEGEALLHLRDTARDLNKSREQDILLIGTPLPHS